jgi:glucosamine kinase
VLYYLGIDGGGTKTTCAMGDDTRMLAIATAGPSNIVRVGEMQARDALLQSVRQACAAAGITPAQISRTCVGGSGAARPELAEVVRRCLAEIIATPIDVVGDMEIALEAAFDGGPGVIVIAGTGSIAYGRDEEGTAIRAGGWGYAIGDEGSAHWIGRAAVAAVLRAADPRVENSRSGSSETSSPPDLSLSAALLKTWGVTSLSNLARAANSIPTPDFAALFPAVSASSDALASEVLTKAGRELADIAVVVIRRLFAQHTGSVPVAMVGGVFRHAAMVRRVFYDELGRLAPLAEVSPQVVEPVEGALRMARRASRGADAHVRHL